MHIQRDLSFSFSKGWHGPTLPKSVSPHSNRGSWVCAILSSDSFIVSCQPECPVCETHCGPPLALLLLHCRPSACSFRLHIASASLARQPINSLHPALERLFPECPSLPLLPLFKSMDSPIGFLTSFSLCSATRRGSTWVDVTSQHLSLWRDAVHCGCTSSALPCVQVHFQSSCSPLNHPPCPCTLAPFAPVTLSLSSALPRVPLGYSTMFTEFLHFNLGSFWGFTLDYNQALHLGLILVATRQTDVL